MRLYDLGVGLAVLALSAACLYAYSGFPLAAATSPRRKRDFYLLYLAALVLQIPSSIYCHLHGVNRPEHAVLLPVVSAIMSALFFAVVGSLAWFVVLRKAVFPAPVCYWPSAQSRFNTILTAACAALLLLCLHELISALWNGDPGGVLAAWVIAYLFLSARAGLLSS